MRFLVELGHHAEHVGDRQMAAASDTQIWDFAVSTGAVIRSIDEDFARRRSMTDKRPRIVRIRLRNTRRSELLSWFGEAVPNFLEAFDRGETLVELI